MSEFNPYREWLGIDLSGKPTYYQLIGVSPSEEDIEVIRKSALDRLRKLEQVDCVTPAHQQLKQQLTIRIKRAAKCLMNDESRVRYDRQLLSANQQLVHLDRASGQVGEIIGDDSGISQAGDVAIDADAKPAASISKRYKTRQTRNNTILLCLVMGLISIAGLGFLLLTQTDLGRTTLGLPNQSALIVRNNEDVAFDEDVEALPMNAEDFADDRSTRDQELAETITPVSESNLDRTAVTNSATSSPPAPKDLQELQNALIAAHNSLQNRDPAQAKQRLNDIRALPMRVADREKYDRLLVLADYVEQYWQALDDGLAKLQAGTEFVVAGTRMIVVENNADQLIVRSNGQNRNLPRNNLPLDVELAIADGWFKGNAASTKVFRGAMMAVTPGFEPDEVRELWRQASEEGVDIGDLEQVLDDDYHLIDSTP